MDDDSEEERSGIVKWLLDVGLGRRTVTGDTWIRREELIGSAYLSKTNRLDTVPSAQPSPFDPQLADPCRNRTQSHN
jgi:hypothetical protein